MMSRLGWQLVTQGREVFEARHSEEPPWDDSWDPVVGEEVAMFVDSVREELGSIVAEPVDEAPAPTPIPAELQEQRLSQLAWRDGYPRDPNQSAWYRVGVAGSGYAALTIYQNGSHYTEALSYFVAYPGQDPHAVHRAHLDTRVPLYGSVLRTRLTRITTRLSPVWTPVYGTGLGRTPDRRQILERLFLG